MSTQTIRAPPRRVCTSNKRKEREGFDSIKPAPPSPTSTTKLPKPTMYQLSSGKPSEAIPSNKLLAGYLAHEFLTKGTLFGKPWDPDRAEVEACEEPDTRTEEAEPDKENYQRYKEVSGLLKADGAHLPGVINPCQLCRFFHM